MNNVAINYIYKNKQGVGNRRLSPILDYIHDYNLYICYQLRWTLELYNTNNRKVY